MHIKEFIDTAYPVEMENQLSCIFNMVDAWNLAGLSWSPETKLKLNKHATNWIYQQGSQTMICNMVLASVFSDRHRLAIFCNKPANNH